MAMILPVNPNDDNADEGWDPSDLPGPPNNDPDADGFKPPAEPIEVGCLHCGQVFMSDQMRYVVSLDPDGQEMGFWCCPDPACDGKGFLFDLYPTDPQWRDEEGNLVWSDDDDEENWEEDQDDEDEFEESPGFEPPRDWTPETDRDDDVPF